MIDPSQLLATRIRALPVLLLLAAGCATPGLPQPDVAPGSLTSSALERTQELYLYPERIDRRVMVGALDALEARFDPVRFEAAEDADYGTLLVGSAEARVPLHSEVEPERFQAVLARVLHFVELELGDDYDPRPDETLELVALKGALGSLDRYSTIFSGRGSEDFQIRFSGKLRGIGARIGRRDGQLRAMSVFPKSPAARGGLRDGDGILQIDGRPTQPLSVRDAVGYIRGKEGTAVVLTIDREGERMELEIIRGEVTIPSVEARTLEPGIGYAKITNMSRTTTEEFRKKVQALGSLNGLVLDLRGNTGGSMVAAAQLADLFMERGLIVRIVNREGDALGGRSRAVAKPGVLLGAQVVILVDPSTASAAEILSGAIEPLPRVTIVGQTTFGKGLIQRVMPLPEQNLLKLTVGEYLLSEDRAIHEKGVEPDILLYPVPTTSLAGLAQVPDEALPYLRDPEEEDDFPVELAADMIRHGRPEGLALARERSSAAIQEALDRYGVTWSDGNAAPDEPLQIEAEGPPLAWGRTAALRIRVTNPNESPMIDAWLSLRGPALYLSNRIAALGTIPAGGSAIGEVELTPNNPLTVDPLAMEVLVASGSRAVQADRISLAAEPNPTDLEIAITRVDEQTISVSLVNRGCCDPGTVRVAVPGASRTLDRLPGTVELPITGEAKSVAIMLAGAAVQRRIEVPLPEDHVTVIPPGLALERDSWLGRPRVRVHATADDGLREGWLALDGQKAIYVAWDGSFEGQMRADLGDGDHDVTTKIKTLSGVAVIDRRRLTAD